MAFTAKTEGKQLLITLEKNTDKKNQGRICQNKLVSGEFV